MSAKFTPTVFIIEDDSAICESLRWLFSSVHLETEIYNNSFDYLKVYDPQRVGCLLIDIRLPGMSGLELQQQLVQRNNPIPIIMITGHGDVSLAVRAMKAGAKDFILKPFNNDALLEQIQKAIIENCKYNQNEQQFLKKIAHLTLREKEIMQLIIEGKLNKQIAAALNVSISTVEKHRAHIMQKMQIKSIADLVKQHTMNAYKIKALL